MSNHLYIGKLGEQLAATWLSEHGFNILERNWRYRRKEIDIIAAKDNLLHFVEVKTRRVTSFGLPEERVNGSKLNAMRVAAAAFLEEQPQWRRIQFDVISITLLPENRIINYLEDVS